MDPASARTPIAIQTAWGTSRNRLGCVVIGAIVVHGRTRYTELTETMEKQFVSVISVVSVFIGDGHGAPHQTARDMGMTGPPRRLKILSASCRCHSYQPAPRAK